MSTAIVIPTEQLGKIVKNLVKPCLSLSPPRRLITLNETMYKLYTYVLSGLLLNIANKNVKNDKNVNTLWLQRAYIKLKICEKILKVRKDTEKWFRIAIENNAFNMELRNSSHFFLISSQNSRLMKYI